MALGRVRRPGGGRKSAAGRDPGPVAALELSIEPREVGDPVSPLRWTTASLRDLSRELADAGHPVSAPVVGGLLRAMGFSLQGMAKTRAGSQVPDRDAPFRPINSAAERFLAEGLPVVSGDTKQKEPLGGFARPGRTYRPKGRPITAPDHDFTGPDTPVAIPYGIYDPGRDSGRVNGGTDRSTAAFAVESLRRWWRAHGHIGYPNADCLLGTADSGGADPADSRLFKMGLADFADECGPSITVMHFPPGTSKWNKVAHRPFSRITHSPRGQPLTGHEVLLETISATRTSTKLTVQAVLDENAYPPGRALTRAGRKGVGRRVERDEFHGEWNCTTAPQDPAQQLPEDPRDESGPSIPAGATFLLTRPALTGMPREQFERLVLHLEPCQQVLTEAGRQSAGRDGRGRNPGLGTLDHRHRVLAAVLRGRNTATLTLAAELTGRKRNVLSYHAGRSRPMPAFAGPELARVLVFRRTRPPRTLEALKRAIEQHDNEINSSSS